MIPSQRHERKAEDLSRQLGICQMIASAGYAAFMSRSPEGLTKRYAAVRAIEVIAEATRGLDAEWKAARSDVPWRAIYDMRNLLSHEYRGVDYDLVWNVLTVKLPEFSHLTAIVADPEPYTDL